jgi:hypothetical protein
MADFIPPAKNSQSAFSDMRGHHVAVRVTSLAEAKDFYVNKLDFRVIAAWPYADELLAYVAPPTDDHFFIEILGNGEKLPAEVRLTRIWAIVSSTGVTTTSASALPASRAQSKSSAAGVSGS